MVAIEIVVQGDGAHQGTHLRPKPQALSPPRHVHSKCVGSETWSRYPKEVVPRKRRNPCHHGGGHHPLLAQTIHATTVCGSCWSRIRTTRRSGNAFHSLFLSFDERQMTTWQPSAPLGEATGDSPAETNQSLSSLTRGHEPATSLGGVPSGEIGMSRGCRDSARDREWQGGASAAVVGAWAECACVRRAVESDDYQPHHQARGEAVRH
jgi:hypothetical protein